VQFFDSIEELHKVCFWYRLNLIALIYKKNNEMFLFYPRHLESKLIKTFDQTKVILTVGARQVGKSTLLKHLYPEFQTIVFDPIHDEYNVRENPDLFLKSLSFPVIFDEIQFYPEFLSSLKRFVDQRNEMGQCLLTGSQNFSMLRSVSESMAGRISILNLYPMTFLEKYQIDKPLWIEAYLNRGDLISTIQSVNVDDVYALMWRGGMPGLIGKKDDFVETYFSSYVQTYIERDVRMLLDIKNISDFSKFIRLLAMNSGQEINMAHLGREIGVANSTAIEWRNVLKQSLLLNEIEPFHGNTIKRLSKKSKGYMMDTGLLCYLSMINSPSMLSKHPKAGAVFENFVINMLQVYMNAMMPKVQMYHWRSSLQQEVDLVLEYDGWLYPIEIKLKTKIDSRDVEGIESFRSTYQHQNVHHGIIIYAGDICRYVSDNVIAVPWNSILN